MARFATVAPKAEKKVKPGAKITNYAGGTAYALDKEQELVGILLTSMVQDQYYRSAEDTVTRLRQLIGEVDPLFAAKALVWARNEAGMRTITHVGTAELLRHVKGENWTKNFVEAVVRRPDDMTEIIAYYLAEYGKPLPNALKRGLGRAFGKFDGYQLGKYRGGDKNVSLVDVVNLVRPRPTSRNGEALRKLVEGTLRAERTWQVELSKAGQVAKTEEEKKALKDEAWRKRILAGDEGYFAVLRNLRNILDTNDKEVIDAAHKMLLNEKALRKSLVMPFRFLTAYDRVVDSKTKRILSKAIDLAVSNVPELGGRTLVTIDHSGSMWGRPQLIGDVMAAIALKKADGDAMVFGTTAGYVEDYNAGKDVLTIAREDIGSVMEHGSGTNMNEIFMEARGKYDRVMIFTDQQSWIGDVYYGESVQQALEGYKRRTGADPFIYVFDVGGYGHIPFKQSGKVAQIPGFSDKTFKFMETVETDKDAVVNEIKAVDISEYLAKVE